MMKITLANNIGFCSGVRRAMFLAEKTLEQNRGKKVYSLGAIIHNTEAVRRLESRNLITVDSPEKAPKQATLILPSHGTARSVREAAARRRQKLVDVTCPYVASVQKICRDLSEKKFQVVIAGDSHHPEVRALHDLAPEAVVIEKPEDVSGGMFSRKKVGLISQTTQSRDSFRGIVKAIIDRNPDLSELHVYNTICLDTANRQEEVKRLASTVDVLLVIGSPISANTKRLLALGKKINRKSYLVETVDAGLKRRIPAGATVGVISGASAPQWLVNRIVESIKKS